MLRCNTKGSIAVPHLCTDQKWERTSITKYEKFIVVRKSLVANKPLFSIYSLGPLSSDADITKTFGERRNTFIALTLNSTFNISFPWKISTEFRRQTLSKLSVYYGRRCLVWRLRAWTNCTDRFLDHCLCEIWSMGVFTDTNYLPFVGDSPAPARTIFAFPVLPVTIFSIMMISKTTIT